MSKHNKAREIWLDRYRAALVQACGAAAILGFTDHAATLCEMIDAARVDKCEGKCYNTNNQRRQARETEDNIMTNKIKVWAFTANGIGWERAITMYFDSREHAEAAYAHYTYKDPIYYAGAFASDKFEPAYPLDYGATVHDGQLYPTDKY